MAAILPAVAGPSGPAAAASYREGVDRSPLPPALTDRLEEFAQVPAADRLTLLLEYGDDLPPLPDRFRDPPASMQRVVECQSPVYVAVLAAGRAAGDVRLYVSAAAQAPVTRGFAGLLTGLVPELTADEIGRIPPDLPARLQLTDAVSPLRLNGMRGLLLRVQQQTELACGGR